MFMIKNEIEKLRLQYTANIPTAQYKCSLVGQTIRKTDKTFVTDVYYFRHSPTPAPSQAICMRGSELTDRLMIDDSDTDDLVRSFDPTNILFKNKIVLLKRYK